MNTHVRSITLNEAYDYEPDWAETFHTTRFAVTRETIQPLLSFTKLTALELWPSQTRNLGDSDIIQMFRSWPALTKFDLDDEDMTIAIPQLTINGIHQALQYVPSLQSLAVRFDGSVLPLCSPNTPHKSLQEWYVGTSIIASGMEFGEWLVSNYPTLSSLTYFRVYLSAMDFAYGDHNFWDPDSLDEAELLRVILEVFQSAAIMVDRWTNVQRRVLASNRDSTSMVFHEHCRD